MTLVVWIQCRLSLTERTGGFLTSVIFEADLPVGSIFILTKSCFKLGHRLRHSTNIKATNICKHEFTLFWFSIMPHRIADGGPTSSQHRMNVLSQLGFETRQQHRLSRKRSCLSTTHWTNVNWTLGHRLQRWPLSRPELPLSQTNPTRWQIACRSPSVDLSCRYSF